MIAGGVIDRMAALLIAAFGLVAALAWNGAVQELFRRLFGEQSSLTAMFSYAVFITIIAVFVTLWLGRFSEKGKSSGSRGSKKN